MVRMTDESQKAADHHARYVHHGARFQNVSVQRLINTAALVNGFTLSVSSFREQHSSLIIFRRGRVW